MKNRFIKGLILLPFLFSTKAFSWGSWYQTNGHKFIDEQAFILLKKDKALDDTLFPTIADINANEGVDWNSIGPGPDAEDGELFSNHYYNPQTKKGNAPNAVSKWFTYLSKQLLSGGTILPKAAAWSGHYIADMSVVYHVNGMFKEDYQALEEAQTKGGHGDSVILSEDESGILKYLSYKMLFTHPDNFKTEGDLYLKDVIKHPKHDWFDPWYWNGQTSATIGSSHLEWEAMVNNSIDQDKLNYSIGWLNGEPTFDNPFEAQAERAQEFTIDMAESTRLSTFSYSTYSSQGLTQAIESVATLWRASVSALRMQEPIIEPFSYSPEANKGKFIVHAAIVNYTDKEDALKVESKLQIVSGGTLLLGDAIQKVGVVRKRDGFVGGRWVIETPDIKNLKLKMETIGHFSTIPDLQYTYYDKPLKTFDDTTNFKGKATGSCSGVSSLSIHNGKLFGTISCGDQFSTSLYARMSPTNGQFTANGFGKYKMPKETVDGQGAATGSVNGRKASGTWKFYFQGYNSHGENVPQSISGEWTADLVEQVPPQAE